MYEQLLKVVMERSLLGRDIVLPALKQSTRCIPNFAIDEFEWKQIRHLYIMDLGHSWDSSDGHDVIPGYYTNPECTWVLWLVDKRARSPIIPIISRCGDNLELLHCFDVVLNNLDLSLFPNLKCLRLFQEKSIPTNTIAGINALPHLEELILDKISVKDKLNVSNSPLLKILKLHNINHRIYGINQLPRLQQIDLHSVSLSTNLDFSKLQKLTSLALHSVSGFDVRTCNLNSLSELESLELGSDASGSMLDVSSLTKLKRLILSGNLEITKIFGLECLKSIQVIDLGNSGIEQIPKEIRELKKLNMLDLSHTHLKELPDWLPELGLQFLNSFGKKGICLHDTQVDGIDKSFFEQPQDIILQWFEERKKGNTVPLNEVKVVFLGDGEAGKTHIITRLLKSGAKLKPRDFDGNTTPGIVITNKEYELNGERIRVHFWDFGGQEILHSMHRMFLTDRTLYVVIVNARDDTQDDRARYWLHNIKSFAGSAPVLLVLNKIDQNPSASIDRPNLEKLYSGLKDVVQLSALVSSKDEFNSTFTATLLEQVQKVGTLGTLWPVSWLKLKSSLETMEAHYIHGSDYEALCETCGVEQNREGVLRWFNVLGISFCYDGNTKLKDYVILKPYWLTNAIYIILFNKCNEVENGIIPHETIYQMLKKPQNAHDQIKRVLKDVYYRPEEAEYVLDVIRKFRLSYKIRGDAEFFPVLCQRESMPVAEEYENDSNALEFQMNYDYLPDNVIHRLMVEMRQDLDIQNVWRTGARFIQQGTDLSAVVRSEGDVLRIFVRSNNPLHQPNTYLHVIKSNIDQIITDMKLQPPYCAVIYKADRNTEAFDYEDLIHALQDGETTYRSKVFRRRIPIQDILNQSGRAAEVELIKLRDDLITSCIQLQCNKAFWDATEDIRNTEIRDKLRNMGYLVNDQTFQGISAGEKQAGELDLEIRKDTRIPWTICEALRISSNSATAKSSWNDHLQKLLDNYNPSGLNHLFLLTYVDCDKDHFQGIWDEYSEHIKWFDPAKYERLSSSFSHIDLSSHDNPNYIRVARCTYDRAGCPTTVCHVFVRMGR